MPEKVCEAKMLLVQQVCNRCQEGIMGFTGEVLRSYPEQYIHQCEVCKNTELYNTYYPIQRLIPIEPLREPTKEERIVIDNV